MADIDAEMSIRKIFLAVLIMPNGFSHSFQQTQSGDVYSTLFNRSIAHVSIVGARVGGIVGEVVG